MQTLWQIVASNALLVVVLAAGVALLGRVWKNPLCLHVLWVLVLLKLATPPILTVPVGPPAKQAPAEDRTEVGGTSFQPAKNHGQDGRATSLEAERQKTEFAVEAPALGAIDGESPSLVEDRPSEVAASAVEVSTVAQREPMSWLSILAWTWAAGIAVFGARHVYRILRFRRLLHSGEAPSSSVVGMAEGIAKRLGLRRAPRILMLPVRVSPLVWSLGGRVRVFLPAELFERLDRAAQEAIIAHELAHVRRGDHWVRLIETVVVTLFWWHPVVWWAARQLQELEDQCCDGMVVDMALHDAKSYATALLDTLDFLSERSIAAPLGATATKSSHCLTRRIAMLKNRSWTMRLTFGRLLLLLAVAAVPMAVAFGQKLPEGKDEDLSANQPPANPEESGRNSDLTPLVHLDVAVVEVPRKLDLVGKLSHHREGESWLSSSPTPSWAVSGVPNWPRDGGMVLSEAERKKLIEESKSAVRVVQRLECPLGKCVSVKSNIDDQSLSVCYVKPLWVRDGTLRLRIKPIGALGPSENEGGVKLSRPKDWPAAVFADLKPGEAAVLGGWDDAEKGKQSKDSVTVLVVQAVLAEPAKLGEQVAQKRVINKRIRAFSAKTDLSTPESAMAALQRAYAKPDIRAAYDLCWVKEREEVIKNLEPEFERMDQDARHEFLDTEIVEVLAYGDDFAAVFHKSPKVSTYRVSYFGKIMGLWKSWGGGYEGGSSWPTIRDFEKSFEERKYIEWHQFVAIRTAVESGRPVVNGDKSLLSPDEMRSVSTGNDTKPVSVKASKSGVEKRIVNKLVKDFPEKVDLSTPESAAAALSQALAKKDVLAAMEMSWMKVDVESAKDVEKSLKNDPHVPQDMSQRVLDTEIVEVLGSGNDLAAVVYKTTLSGEGPYGVMYIGKIFGIWKSLEFSLGGTLPSVQAVEEAIEKDKKKTRQEFEELRNAVKDGRTVVMGEKGSRRSKEGKSGEQAGVVQRAINKLVKDFPEKTDLTTPESAQAAWNRASAKKDAKAIVGLSWRQLVTVEEADWYAREQASNPEGLAIYLKAVAESTILETRVYRDEVAQVISLLPFAPGKGRHPYSSRWFGKIDGQWKNLGENRLPSLEDAQAEFDRYKDDTLQEFAAIREQVKTGQPATPRNSASQVAPIAPGEPLGISVEKADLMGRIEWAFMHGGRDITARKSLEWGEIEKDKDGNRTIRYMFEATIWGKESLIANQVFTFDTKGNILGSKSVEGYPKKKVVKPANVGTQAGMKELVEDFFKSNFRDVTSRETIEWGDVEFSENGNSSIRYMYLARIWDRETKIMNQVFTFDRKGEFVSVKNVDGYPKNVEPKVNDAPSATAPKATVAKAEGPAAAIAKFLEAIKTGDDKAASGMLSKVAREKAGKLNRSVTPPASDTAKFTVGKVEMVGEDGARVACVWTDADADGRPKSDEAIWVLRREAEGWRVAGVAAQIFPGEAPVLLNFEDPEDMLRKQQWIREELRRRMEREAKTR